MEVDYYQDLDYLDHDSNLDITILPPVWYRYSRSMYVILIFCCPGLYCDIGGLSKLFCSSVILVW